jgi:hypothetical protein
MFSAKKLARRSISSHSSKPFGNGLESLESRQLMAVDSFGPVISPQHLSPIQTNPAVIQPQIDLDHDLTPQINPNILDDLLAPLANTWVGRWENVNPNTGGVTAIEISNGRGGMKIEAWGACVPSDCEWGKTSLHMLGTSVDDTSHDYAIGQWDPGFKDTVATLAKMENGFVLNLYSIYKDDSGRLPMHQRYLMTNSGDLIETNASGNERLPDVIVGGWVSEDAETRDMTKFLIAENTGSSSAPLTINAFGSCSPSDCDWGQRPMHLVGSSISDDTPYRAVSSWDHGFSKVFLVTRLQGSELVYDKFTVFQDGSDRSNYMSTGSMWKIGDSNHDAVFNSSDLVKVFAAGEYEDDHAGNSTWEEGDWNRDGDFNSADIVEAMQSGGYEASRPYLPPLWNLPIDLFDDFDIGRKPLQPVGPPFPIPPIDLIFAQNQF